MLAVLDLGDLEQPDRYDSIDIVLLQCRILVCRSRVVGISRARYPSLRSRLGRRAGLGRRKGRGQRSVNLQEDFADMTVGLHQGMSGGGFGKRENPVDNRPNCAAGE